MSIITNAGGSIVPVREQRAITGTLGALNAETVLDVNGDESCLIDVRAGAAVTMTVVFEGSVDGTNYFPVLAMPYYALTGTIPVGGQVMITEAFSAVIPQRVYALAVGGLTKIKIRASAWTSGILTTVIRSGPEFSIHPNMFQRVSTLCVTATAATGVAATATLPAVTGLRHYIDRIEVTRSATALLTAGATPIVVTTTNLPGNPAFTFGADAAPQGTDKIAVLDAGATGLAATAIGTATTVVAPLTSGVIWRINVIYRLGL